MKYGFYQRVANSYKIADRNFNEQYKSGTVSVNVATNAMGRWILAFFNFLLTIYYSCKKIWDIKSYQALTMRIIKEHLRRWTFPVPDAALYFMIFGGVIMSLAYSLRSVAKYIKDQKEVIVLGKDEKPSFQEKIAKQYKTKLLAKSEKELFLGSRTWYKTYITKHWEGFNTERDLIQHYLEDENITRRMNSAAWSHSQIQVLLQAIALMRDGVEAGDGNKQPMWKAFIDSCDMGRAHSQGEDYTKRIADAHKEVLERVAEHRKNFADGNEFLKNMQSELTSFLYKWQANSHYHKNIWNHFDTCYKNKTHIGFYTKNHSDTQSRSFPVQFDAGVPTQDVQKALCELLYMIQKSNFNMLLDHSNEEFSRMRENLVKDLEFQIIDRLPNEKKFGSNFNSVIGVIGPINAICNAFLLLGTGYPLIKKYIGFSSMGFGQALCLVALGAGFYISYNFTFDNVKTFINSLKTSERILPLHHYHMTGYLNIFLGLLMGACSGFFSFEVVKGLFVGHGAIFRLAAANLGLEAFYLAHLGIFPILIAFFAAVITFVCASFLYINQCLQTQRKEYARGTLQDWWAEFSNMQLRFKMSSCVKYVLVSGATAMNMVQFGFSLYARKAIGGWKYSILLGVIYVWYNSFKLTFDEIFSSNRSKDSSPLGDVIGAIFSPFKLLWGMNSESYYLNKNYEISEKPVKHQQFQSQRQFACELAHEETSIETSLGPKILS